MKKKTPKAKRARNCNGESRCVQRVVRRLVRHFQKYRREAMADEPRLAKAGMYKRAIEQHERAATLESVINAIKSYKPSNDPSSATAAEKRSD